MDTKVTLTVVAGAFSGAPQINLGHEIRLVKAGLLYADSVQLASFQAVMISTVAAAYVAPPAVQKQLIEKILSERDPASAALVEQLRILRRKRGKSHVELIELARLEELFSQGGDLIRESLAGILGESGVSELITAAEAGVVTIHPLGMDQGHGLDEGLVGRFADMIRDLIRPGSGAFPLFDDDAGSLAKALATDSTLPGAVGGRAREARIAGDLIGTLPAFPDAPMAAVLEAREHLQGPLTRFRSAMVALAADVAEFPGDADFEVRVSDLWREKVAPALLELAELERERRIQSLLRYSILSNPSTRAIEAGIGALSFTADALPGLIAAATAAAIETAAAGYRRAQEIESKRSSNQFGFLFAADKSLLKR